MRQRPYSVRAGVEVWTALSRSLAHCRGRRFRGLLLLWPDCGYFIVARTSHGLQHHLVWPPKGPRSDGTHTKPLRFCGQSRKSFVAFTPTTLTKPVSESHTKITSPAPVPVSLVRTSRDGDQFHYLWAARRSLLLLDPTTDLVAIAIEGAAVTAETIAGSSAAAEASEADEIIDVAEYRGHEDIAKASAVRYAQLKHSTRRAHVHWPPSGLEKTLSRFATKFRDLRQQFGNESVSSRFTFAFVSNRPVDAEFVETISDVAAKRPPRHPALADKLKRFAALDGDELAEFARVLQIEDKEDAYILQRQNLASEFSAYLPDSDADAPFQLKELVTRKALSESAANNVIRKHDVLRALGTDVRELFPAENKLEQLADPIPRAYESDIVAKIVGAGSHPVLLHAEGGVGKSVLVSRLAGALPAGSVCAVYDCFGSGMYRQPTAYRHTHDVALVQVANELATRGLCHPLIPSPKAGGPSYLRAFLSRLAQAAGALRQSRSVDNGGFICVVFDAADNAEIAANELGTHSFVRNLIRERVPDGVRIVFVTRTHRQDRLDPPVDTVRLPLQPFDEAESAAHLRRLFPLATKADAAEFHRLTSANPRLQSFAMAGASDLQSVLRSLGPVPATVETSIKTILDQAVARLKDSVSGADRTMIDTVCTALATLRPLIPVDVLAKMSGVDASAIRSFALDLGRPLLLTDETIRFRDEPTETWFRDQFRPTADDLRQFVDRLKPLAAVSAYVASALPPLMLEAGMLDELLASALDATVLPHHSALDRRDVELQRLQFALRASLRARRWTDAAMLALKSGTATAGNDRRRKLLQENTDLAGRLMLPDHVLELVSRREFGGAWTGSHHAYDAGILSAKPVSIPEARSHLRMADDWLRNWSRLPPKEREKERIADDDIAEMALAFLNVVSPQACAKWLRTWSPRTTSYSAGSIVAARLVDSARYDELEALAIAAGNDAGLVLAVNQELRRVGRGAPAAAVQRAVALLGDTRVPSVAAPAWEPENGLLVGIVELAVEARRQATHAPDTLARLITKYLPTEIAYGLGSPHSSSRPTLLRAYALRAEMTNTPLTLAELAPPEARKEMEAEKAQHHQESGDLRELRAVIGTLLPWCLLWARNAVHQVGSADIERLAADALRESDTARARTYRDDTFLNDEIAPIWTEILLDRPDPLAPTLGAFDTWASELKSSLGTRTLTVLARRAARHSASEPHKFAMSYASDAAKAIEAERTHSATTSDDLTKVARALLALSPAEAEAHFDRALDVASRVGDENLDRWGALVELAKHAANSSAGKPELAYRLARCAEVSYDYVVRDKHFPWQDTVEAMAGLCPRSCLAIASRWRDRHFGDPARVLPLALEFMLRRGDVDARALVALTGIRAYWDKGAILGAALAEASSNGEREALWTHALRYARLEPPDAKVWAAFKELQTRYSLPGDDLAAVISHTARAEQEQEYSTFQNESPIGDSSTREPDWNAIFAGANVTETEDLAVAYQRFMNGDAPYFRERFFRAAAHRVPTGSEAMFISAVGRLPTFDPYECRTLVESMPAAWSSQSGVRAAIASLVRALCVSHWTEITLNRYWPALPMTTAAKASGLTVDQIVEIVLAEAGRSTELFDSGRMFSLIGLVSTKLDDVTAHQALEYGLDQFGDVLNAADGDGPWSNALVPTGDLRDAIAGYLWAGFANPRDVVRWETAHAILGTCELGCSDLVDRVVALASASSGVAGGGGPFADATLMFYRYNAIQWLLIALHRAAVEFPSAVAPHLAFLTRHALEGEPHVLVRHLAARAALAIDVSAPGALDSAQRDRLAAVNNSPFPPTIRTGYGRVGDAPQPDSEQDDFYFGIDIGPYWFEPLARRFGVSEKEIERRARRVIRDTWKVDGNSRWDADPRARRKLYSERETYHSHGDRPRSDNLHFYLSYHAMMVVAGELLSSHPLVRHPDDDDDFVQWIARHSLTRDDGRWLADRRDPAPLDLPVWSAGNEHDKWRWSLVRSDFDSQLFRDDDRVTLWGSWTRLRGYRAETVSIRSALVSPDRSRSLLAALQTANDPNDYGIPADEGDLEISSGGYELRGWIATHDTSMGIDDRDPWSGEIGYPGVTPAPHVSALMSLLPDSEGRVWQRNGDDALVSQLWGEFPDQPDRDETERGYRLHVSTDFLTSFLQATKKHLIVKVSIERRFKYGRLQQYTNDSDREMGPILPSVRLFLFESDGNVETVS